MLANSALGLLLISVGGVCVTESVLAHDRCANGRKMAKKLSGKSRRGERRG